MRTFKWIVLFITLFFLSIATTVSADNHELSAQQKFDQLKEAGIFTGFEDGSSQLEASMTRAQMATILARLFNLEEQNSNQPPSFADISSSHWAFGYIEASRSAGLLQGYGNGSFGPSDPVTIEQLAAVITRSLGVQTNENAPSIPGASEWAQPYVAAAIQLGIINSTTSYTTPAQRSQLVHSAYQVNQPLENVELNENAQSLGSTIYSPIINGNLTLGPNTSIINGTLNGTTTTFPNTELIDMNIFGIIAIGGDTSFRGSAISDMEIDEDANNPTISITNPTQPITEIKARGIFTLLGNVDVQRLLVNLDPEIAGTGQITINGATISRTNILSLNTTIQYIANQQMGLSLGSITMLTDQVLATIINVASGEPSDTTGTITISTGQTSLELSMTGESFNIDQLRATQAVIDLLCSQFTCPTGDNLVVTDEEGNVIEVPIEEPVEEPQPQSPSPSPPSPTVTSLDFTADDIVLINKGARFPIRAIATFSNNTTRDVTNEISWNISFAGQGSVSPFAKLENGHLEVINTDPSPEVRIPFFLTGSYRGAVDVVDLEVGGKSDSSVDIGISYEDQAVPGEANKIYLTKLGMDGIEATYSGVKSITFSNYQLPSLGTPGTFNQTALLDNSPTSTMIDLPFTNGIASFDLTLNKVATHSLTVANYNYPGLFLDQFDYEVSFKDPELFAELDKNSMTDEESATLSVFTEPDTFGNLGDFGEITVNVVDSNNMIAQGPLTDYLSGGEAQFSLGLFDVGTYSVQVSSPKLTTPIELTLEVTPPS